MRRTALFLGLVIGCAHAEQQPTGPASPLTLPDFAGEPAVALRMFVIGDGGAPGPNHDAVFGAVRALANGSSTPAVVLMPGDLTYPAGLPATCPAALQRLREDYLEAVPTLPVIVALGNHDHGDLPFGTNPQIASRDAWFDCSLQASVTAITGWTPDACPCEQRWHDPAGVQSVGTWQLAQDLTLVIYDSQAALAQPEAVGKALEEALGRLAPSERLIVMAHHPLVTVGPHGQQERGPQDLSSPTYGAYARRFTDILGRYSGGILLAIYGHDHNLQFFPGHPPELISGAGSKTSPVTGKPQGGVALGDTPGFAVVDVLVNDGLRITLVWDGAPQVFDLPPAPIRPPEAMGTSDIPGR
jgi:hypothetical protein